jgi:Flp pilus assembly pilin Flp
MYAWEGVKPNMWTKLNEFALSLVARTQIAREEGQALVEYSLILALVSVAAIVLLTLVGTEVNTVLTKVTTALKGA